MVSGTKIHHKMNDALVLKLFQFWVKYIPSYWHFSCSTRIQIKSEVKKHISIISECSFERMIDLIIPVYKNLIYNIQIPNAGAKTIQAT